VAFCLFKELYAKIQKIKMAWIEHVFRFPEHEQTQTDGRQRKWGYITEVDKYLRIVVLED